MLADRKTGVQHGAWRAAERAAWIFGGVCLAVWGIGQLDRAVSSQREMARFAAARADAVDAAVPASQILWSPQRIAAWKSAMQEPAPAPLAMLRIPKIALEVAVLPGTDEITLNRALGHIEDTALPGADGNSGIAGHRDGYFRGLKDIATGDLIELETVQSKATYRVERTWIVDPEDVSVLDPTPGRSITLVTCYPFYFVGSAPQRFIVRAEHVDNLAASRP